jgi:hypothetical protein
MRTGPEKKNNARRSIMPGEAYCGTNSGADGTKQLAAYRLPGLATIGPQLYALFGVHPGYWDPGKVATQDTVGEGLCLWIYKRAPLMAKAVEESVGACKECIRIVYNLCI